MLEQTPKVAGRTADDWSSSIEHALAGVAKQQAQRDSQRRLLDEALRTASFQTEKLSGETPAHLRVLPAEIETGDRFNETAARDFEPARAGIARESDSPRYTHSQHPPSDPADRVRGTGDMFPHEAPLPLSRMIGVHASSVEDRSPSGPVHRAGPMIGEKWRYEGTKHSSGLDAAEDPITRLALNRSASLRGRLEVVGSDDMRIEAGGLLTKALAQTLTQGETFFQATLGLADPIAQLARNYRDPVHTRPEMVGPEDLGVEPEGQFTRAFAKNLGQSERRSQSLLALDEQASPFKKPDLGELYQYHQPDEPSGHAARVQTIAENLSRAGDPGVSTLGSVLDGLSGHFDAGGQRPDSTNALAKPDRDRGRNRDDGRSYSAVGNDSTNEAMAATTSELERLRSAVKKTIDDLERVRGAVHPPLPALPVNRGSFRIS
jgi:hypothetical protein